ncbi:hypothetical protein J6O48_02215 [bacterium]|nr:hypothetical protein [bacterium]
MKKQKQMNTIIAIVVAWLISIVICNVIGCCWVPVFLEYPLNYSISITYLIYPLCKNNFNYEIAYPSIFPLIGRIIMAFTILIILNSIHPLAEQIRMKQIH